MDESVYLKFSHRCRHRGGRYHRGGCRNCWRLFSPLTELPESQLERRSNLALFRSANLARRQHLTGTLAIGSSHSIVAQVSTMSRPLLALLLAMCLLATAAFASFEEIDEVEEDLSDLHDEDWETWEGFDPKVVADENDFTGDAPDFEIVEDFNSTDIENMKRYTRRGWWQRCAPLSGPMLLGYSVPPIVPPFSGIQRF